MGCIEFDLTVVDLTIVGVDWLQVDTGRNFVIAFQSCGLSGVIRLRPLYTMEKIDKEVNPLTVRITENTRWVTS